MENIFMTFGSLIVAALAFVTAYFTNSGKFTLFTTILNSRMDESEKKKLQEKRRLFSVRMLIAMGIAGVATFVLHLLKLPLIEYLAVSIFLFLLVVFVSMTIGGGSKPTFGILVGLILAGVFYFNSYALMYGMNTASIENGELVIYGAKNVSFPITTIQEIKWLDERPDRKEPVGDVIERNGTFRGTYVMEDGQQAQVYYNGAVNCVYIKTQTDQYYISLTSDEYTVELYENLKNEESLSSLCK